MLHFTRSAGNQYLSVPDGAGLTFPDGVWTLAWIVAFDGVLTGDNPQYFLSTGSYGSAGSLNVIFYTSGSSATISRRNQVCVALNTNTNPDAAELFSASTFTTAGQARLFVAQRNGTSFTLRSAPILSAAPIDGSAVVTEMSSTWNSSLTTLDGPAGLFIGGRADVNTSRLCDQSLGRLFRYDGTLTDLEVAKLAYGMEITDLGKTPAWYIRGNDAADTTDRGSQANTITQHGTITNGQALAFGYSAVPAPAVLSGAIVATPALSGALFSPYTAALSGSIAATPALSGSLSTAANAIDATDVTAHRIFQRTAGVAGVALSGTYAGSTPGSIEYQLYAANGSTVLQPWVALSATISGGTWSAAPAVPQGGMYRLATRSKDGGGVVLATSAIKSNLWGVGDLFACVGSSSPAKWFDGSSANGATPAANVRVYNLSGSSAWSTISTDCCGVIMANLLAAAASLPVGMLAYGVGGDTLTGNWTNTSASSWTNFVAGVSAVGGKLAGVFVSVGSNDAANGWLQSRASHLANLRTLVANIRSTTGQPALPMLLSGFNRRPGVATNQANWCRMAENDIGSDANVYSVQILDFELSGDNIHLTPAGFAACANRITPVFARALYGDGSYLRGPMISGYSAAGSTITVALAHRNGSDVRKPVGGTGWTATDASGALTIIAIARIDSAHIALTCNRAIVPPFQVQFMSGAAPDASAQTFDNGTPALPITVETDLAQRAFSITLYTDAAKTQPAVGMTGIAVRVYEPGAGVAPIYENTSAATDANGVLSGYATTVYASGTSGRIEVRTSDNRYYTGPVALT